MTTQRPLRAVDRAGVMPQHHHRPGLLARVAGAPEHSADPLVAAFELAIKTRPGETLGDPLFGMPCFADLVHGDRAAALALRSQLRSLLSRVAPNRRGLEITATLDREAAALRIVISDRSDPDAQTLTSATIDALGIVHLDHTPTAPRRRR